MSVPSQQLQVTASPSAHPTRELTAAEIIGPPPAPVWLQRLSLIVLVVFCVYLGLLIAVLPWWRDMWDRNGLLMQYPVLHAFLVKGPVRGLISGVGVLDLWIGISELIHYRDYRK
jgi:hypothetical protein